MNTERNGYPKQDLIFAFCITACLLLQFWKATIGFASSDETFYTVLGNRILQGDALFYDIYDISQMMTVFIAPFIALFRTITGSLNGILLWMRQVYGVLNTLTGLLIYLRFRKKGYAAILVALLFMVFTPFNVMALSYNTLNLFFVVWALLIMPEDQNSIWRMLLSGFLMACAVLNSPFLILLYALLVLAHFIDPKCVTTKALLSITAGALIAAGCFLAFVLSRASVSSILASLPHMMDTAHSSFVISIAKNIAKTILAFGICSVLFLAELVLLLIWYKKPDKHAFLTHFSLGCTVFSILYITLLRPYDTVSGGHALVLLPVVFYELVLLVLDRPDDYILSFFITGLALSFALFCSTNVGPSSTCGPLILCVMLFPLISNTKKEQWTVSFAVIAVLLVFKTVYLFGGTTSGNTMLCETGPYRGLYTSSKELGTYQERLPEFEVLRDRKEPYLSIYSWSTWGYLVADKRIADAYTYLYSYTAQDFLETQERIWPVTKKKVPCLLYVDDSTPYFIDLAGKQWLKQYELLYSFDKGSMYLSTH